MNYKCILRLQLERELECDVSTGSPVGLKRTRILKTLVHQITSTKDLYLVITNGQN